MMSFDITEAVIEFNLYDSLQLNNHEEEFLLYRKKENYIEVFTKNNDQSLKQMIEKKVSAPVLCTILREQELLLEMRHLETKIKLYNSIIQYSHDSEINTIEIFFDTLFQFCIAQNISDIHIEAKEQICTIRTRIDGNLIKLLNVNLSYFGSISSYAKLIAKLDISQRRLPQNGRFSKKYSAQQYDFRISSMPTINGESIVIRILHNQKIKIDLHTLNIESSSLNLIENLLRHSSGLILVSGPTGSGKTTTLYSMLAVLNDTKKKIITIEDPVEYKMQHIQQIAINNEIGLDFATALRDVLRQDPDIIMIGEIRDQESLNIAIAAALTGHLVLATIHTNNSLLTLDRMIDLGADPFLIASTLKGVIAQRLIKRICQKCNGIGCLECNISGFYGREIVTEVFINDAETIHLIAKKATSKEILENILLKDFQTMLENGKEKASLNLIRLEDLVMAVN